MNHTFSFGKIQRISWENSSQKEEVYEGIEEEGSSYITECVKKLPEKYRTIIHLYYYEEYSQKEIADMLYMKENTVASRLARGREKLKKNAKTGAKFAQVW